MNRKTIFERMSFLENLILGLIGSEIIDDAKTKHRQRIQDREQRRHDSLFWQDAARRESNAYGEEGNDKDDWSLLL